MQIDPKLEDLAQELRMGLREARNGSSTPILLFLGAGVAAAAHVPTTAELARTILAGVGPNAGPAAAMPDLTLSDDAQAIQALSEYLGSLSSLTRLTLLQQAYSSIPVPHFYQDMARLIGEGYFRKILTTDINTLLEEALNQLGKRRGIDYRVTNFFDGDSSPDTSARSSYGVARNAPAVEETGRTIRIVKLHGDLSQDQIALTPEEIADVLMPNRFAVKGELSGTLLMIGYEFESPPVNKFLDWTPGKIWWVTPEPPPPDKIASIAQAHEIVYLTGDDARPDRFFGLLTMLLDRMRAAEEIGAPETAPLPTVVVRSVGRPPAPQLEEQYLRDQLKQSQANLNRLEFHLTTQKPDAQLQIQIDYERRQIITLEDKLRAHLATGEELIELAREIARAAHRNNADPGAVSFLRKQVNTLRAEYARDQPCLLVVGAALGAALLMAQRLGKDVVDTELVARLAPLAPSAVRR